MRSAGHNLSAISSSLREVLGEIEYVRILSDANNIIYLVKDRAGVSYVVKAICDEAIDPYFLRRCGEVLSKFVRVAQIISIQDESALLGCPMIVLEYVDGVSIAEAIETTQLSRETKELIVDAVIRTVIGCREIDFANGGFGLLKRGRRLHSSYKEFVLSYIDRYCSRLNECLGPRSSMQIYTQRLTSMFDSFLAKPMTLGTFPFDLNLRNFMLSDSLGPMLLNIPIIGRGDLRFGCGAALAQFRGTDLHGMLLGRLAEGLSDICLDNRTLAFYEALTLVGILAFHCSSGPEAVSAVRIWGSKRPILAELNACIEQMAD